MVSYQVKVSLPLEVVEMLRVMATVEGDSLSQTVRKLVVLSLAAAK